MLQFTFSDITSGRLLYITLVITCHMPYAMSAPLTSGSVESRMDAEKAIKRNPHPDFKAVEKNREPWDTSLQWTMKQTVNPNWEFGGGANDGGASLKIPHVEIDPYENGRPAVYNYKLLISGIIPRPIGFVSTKSADGASTNLAPFSYFQMINHDPPLFTLGFSGGFDNAKDSLKNLSESGECVINIISEHFIEAAKYGQFFSLHFHHLLLDLNWICAFIIISYTIVSWKDIYLLIAFYGGSSTSINAPFGVSEWATSGLTPGPCSTVKASRVKEAIFAIEGKLESTREFESRVTPGKKTGVLAIVEGTRFWVREDAINEERNIIDPAVSGQSFKNGLSDMGIRS
jgi:flavin reductase (DIM6/NTAB) family NADH-FMN oxidoreductase RutF